MKISVTDGKKRDIISLDVKKSPRLPDVTGFSKGDKVGVYATVFAKKKEINGEKRYFENLAVQDIALMEAAPEIEEKDERPFLDESVAYSNRSILQTVMEGI